MEKLPEAFDLRHGKPSRLAITEENVALSDVVTSLGGVAKEIERLGMYPHEVVRIREVLRSLDQADKNLQMLRVRCKAYRALVYKLYHGRKRNSPAGDDRDE